MNDQNPVQPQPSASGFVIPTHSPEGQSLTAKQQFETMRKNDAWVGDSTKEGTQARQQLNDLNRRMAAETEAAAENPLLLEQPAQDGRAYNLGWDLNAIPEAAELDAAARAWLTATGAPAAFGSSLMAHLNELATRSQGWTDMQKERDHAEGMAILRQTYGDELDGKIDAAGAMLDEIDAENPGLLDLIEVEPHLFRNGMTLHYLIQLADARSLRAAGRT